MHLHPPTIWVGYLALRFSEQLEEIPGEHNLGLI